MPLISSSIPNLINGVSQQPAALRLASQAEQVVNCFPSPVEGLKKRPPFANIAKIITGSGGAGRPFVQIVDRDGTIQYLVVIQDNAIKVFGLDGSVKTVSTPNGTSYLDIAGEPSQVFRTASVADYTFIVNREKTVAMAADLSPTWGTKSMVFVKSAEYGTNYSVTINGTTVNYATLPAGGRRLSGSYSQSSTPAGNVLASFTVTVTINGHGLVTGDSIDISFSTGNAVAGTYTISVTSANVFTYTAPNSNTTNGNCTVVHEPNYTPATVEIALALKNGLASAFPTGWTFTANDYIINIIKNDGSDYTLAAKDDKNGLAIAPLKGVADAITDLPVTAQHGFIIKVVGSAATNFDDYYVKFEANAGSGFGHGVWRETTEPNTVYKFDATTMPHVLIRNSNGTFTFQQFTWSGRVAGDSVTAPEPSFVGSKIQNVNTFRNRLVFLADENVILSGADAYDRFWPESVQTVTDADPIDLLAGGQQINFLVSSLAFANALLLFSRHGQFRLDSGTSAGGFLTPKTATITQVTTFEMTADVDPVGLGRTIYFPTPKGDYSGVREFFLPDASGPIPQSEEVTASVPRFVPTGLSTMVASVAEETLVAISKNSSKRIYLYKFFFQEDKKLQSAWSYWELSGGKVVIGAAMLVDTLYILVQYSDGVYLEKASLQPQAVDTGSTFEILVDRKTTEASCSVALTNPAGLDLQSTITLPYPINSGSQMVVVGRTFTGNTIQPGQVIYPISTGSNTLVVRGNLTASKFYVGELYDMLYEFSTQYLKEQPPGGGMAVIAGPRLQLRTWTMIFDQSSFFEVRVTPKGRDTYTYPYNAMDIGNGEVLLGEPGIRTNKFRVPVMTQNIDAQIQIASSSPLPCRLQSAEWEGWYHTRSARL